MKSKADGKEVFLISRGDAILMLLETAFAEGIDTPGLVGVIKQLEELEPDAQIEWYIDLEVPEFSFEMVDANTEQDRPQETVRNPFTAWTRHWADILRRREDAAQ